MSHRITHTSHITRLAYATAIVMALAFTACQDDADNEPALDGMGTIRLSLADAQDYTLLTRTEQAVADLTTYTFTLNGTTIGGVPVTDLVLDVSDQGTAQVSAGTYTLSAHNQAKANTDNGHPYYSGTSASFTVDAGQTQAVSIALGKPKNARITYTIDDTFAALYDAPTVSLSDGVRTITLTQPADYCYFIIPADGALAYTITATAKAGSHVTDMTQSTGYVELQAGYATTIRLKANPATGIIIPVAEGQYSGTFD